MKVGIVGAGGISRKGHLPIYGTIPEIEVTGIADLDLELAKKVATEFHIPNYYSSYKELLLDKSIDIIDICTPPQTHKDIAIMAANNGKHIIMEKPLALSLTDAKLIDLAVKAAKVELCTMYNWRYFSGVMPALDRISKGYIGKIVTIHGLGLLPFPTGWTLGSWPYHKGGTLFDFGPHLVDMILLMKNFSPVKRIYASGGDITQGNMDFINYAVINIEFLDGSIGIADISWVSGLMQKFTLDIHGTGGSISLDVRSGIFSEYRGYPTPVDDLKYTFKKLWKVGNGIFNRSYFIGAVAGFKPLFTGFLSSIKNTGFNPSPIEQALLTVAILEGAKISITEKRPVEIKELIGQS